MKNKFLVGQFLKPHGLKGGIKLRSFMQNPEDILSQTVMDESGQTYTFKQYGSPQKGGAFLVWVNDGLTRDEAERLQSKKLYLDREKTQNPTKDEFFYDDLKGMKVMADGAEIGIVSHVLNYGAGDILEIKMSNGSKKLISFQDQAVLNVDTRKNEVEIDVEHLL